MHIRRLLLPSLLIAVAGSCQTSDRTNADEAMNKDLGSNNNAATDPALEQPKEISPTEAIATSAQDSDPQGGGMQGAQERMQREMSRRQVLSAASIEMGDTLKDIADFQGALAEYAAALEIDPSNETARARLREIQTLMGGEYATAAQYFDDEVQQQSVRRAQAQLEAAKQAGDGDDYRRLGQFDMALESYRKAESILRFHPLVGTDTLDERVVREKIRSTLSEANEAGMRAELASVEAARKEQQMQDQERSDYRARKLRTLYGQANDAFLNERYSLAETLSGQILIYDPGNETAIELRDLAQEARHQSTRQDTYRRYREEWVRTMEDIEYLGTPQTDVVVFDDMRRWGEVSQRTSVSFSIADPEAEANQEAILARLQETRVPVNFGEDGEGAPLEEVARFLQSVSGVNFIVSPTVLDELDPDDTAVLLTLPDRSVRKLLDLIIETKEELRWKIQDGVVKFVTADELTGGQVLRMYEVRDLIRPVRDFPGRDINVQPSGGLDPVDEDFEEREALVITADVLESTIQDNIAVDSWEEGTALRISNGTLVVYQTPEVHEQIAQLLDDLREATGIMVDIQSRFLKVEDNFLEDIGVDFRGLGQPGRGTNQFFDDFGNGSAQQTIGNEIGTNTRPGAFFDDGNDGSILARTENLFDSSLGDEDVLQSTGGLAFQWTYLNDLQLQLILQAVSKSERVEVVTAPNVLVFNTARSNLTVMNQLAYLQDFDVEIAQAASIADPIIGVVQDGVVLDVRPVVSADRRFITLELRPTVATLKRPIRTFTTSLGVSGNTVTIQLPELEISRVRTSVPMPDGGTVLLGGFKVHEEQDLRSGVPILNKIPIVSFLFEEKGHYVSNRKLLILLKAQIVILQEQEPTDAEMGLDETLKQS
ncbi:MAG: type II secretory pathway component GspD/PulD (secretin)/tetratricopeptide (TPR) repeat protein [Planctomycetota bacterium]|jgi:type II secretory pathway component GspD/PulD (secretin)/tetratricopeptide (TPR) repeat protein